MSFTLLQWNVWIFEKKENVLSLIKELDPDVICMQELTADSTFQGGVNVMEYLAKELSYNQFHKLIPNLAPSEGVGDLANGILTRFPIIKTNWNWIKEPSHGGSTYDDQYRLYAEVTLEIGKKYFTFGTAHVSYAHRFEDSPIRKHEVDKLLKIISQKKKGYIFSGDLNSKPNSYLVSELQKLLVHAGPELGVNTFATKPFSYNGFKETELNWRLDYVFTTKDVDVISSDIVRTKYSDHLPIITKISTD